MNTKIWKRFIEARNEVIMLVNEEMKIVKEFINERNTALTFN